DFHFKYFLTNAFSSQRTVFTLFWTRILECLIFSVIAVISIRVFPKTSWCEMFIESYRLWFIAFIISNHGLLSHSIDLFIYWFIIITCIHRLITQIRK